MILVLVAAAVPSVAAARAPSVFINDVKVDGLTGQSFKGVDVVFDENGDVRITAKGYKIAVVDGAGAAAAPSPTAPSQAPPSATAPRATAVPTGAAPAGAAHFFIATVQPHAGAAQWDVDVYINNVFVRRFRSRDAEPYFEITRFLRVGSNNVRFLARKEEGERISTSPTDYFELVLGDGESRNGQVMMNRITSYRRTAAEEGTYNAETIVTVQAQ